MGNSNSQNIEEIQNKCKFCRIKNKNSSDEILYEDDLIVMFADINPRARVHIQVVPKEHIKNINYLYNEHYNLLVHMQEKSKEYFEKTYGDITDL